MQDEAGFRQFLKRAGKKPHVVDGLVAQVQAFAAYLRKRQTGLEAATEQDIRDYVATLPQGDVKKRMRALALYYGFTGNAPLAKMAGDIREQEIARTRQAFRLREFRGVSVAFDGIAPLPKELCNAVATARELPQVVQY